jgi:hypothetical protein
VKWTIWREIRLWCHDLINLHRRLSVSLPGRYLIACGDCEFMHGLEIAEVLEEGANG